MQRTPSQQTHSENRTWFDVSKSVHLHRFLAEHKAKTLHLYAADNKDKHCHFNISMLCPTKQNRSYHKYFLSLSPKGLRGKLHKMELLQHPEGQFFLHHPCLSLQPSFKPNEDHVLLQNYKLIVKISYTVYAIHRRKYCRDSLGGKGRKSFRVN